MKKSTAVSASPTRRRHHNIDSGLVSEDIRRMNRSEILTHLFRDGVMSRTALAASTGLTPAAVSRIAEELVTCGLIKEAVQASTSPARGRPQIGLSLHPEGAFVIGIGVGAFEQWIQLTNLRGECLARTSTELLKGASALQAIQRMAREARSLAREARAANNTVLGVVVAVAGVVDHATGVVLQSPNIGWQNIALGEILHKSLQWPVQVEAMHHVLNLAESLRPASAQASSTVLVNVAMGIGASVMEEGRIVRGSHAAAGQIGHLRVVADGELCTCGKRGCLDTVASGFAVLRRLGRIPARRVAREHSLAEASLLTKAITEEREGNPRVKDAFRQCGEQLGLALEAVRAMADPERIWLAGPLCETHSFAAGVRSSFRNPSTTQDDALPVPITFSTQSSDGAAALLALHRFAFGPQLDIARLRQSCEDYLNDGN